MSNKNRPKSIIIVSILMIIFGLAEVITGFTHNFLGLISTTPVILSTYGASGIGVLYAVGGILLLTMKKSAATLTLACLTVVIVGRITLVLTGLYPINTFLQVFSIVIGTSIAIIFFIYIGMKWNSFK